MVSNFFKVFLNIHTTPSHKSWNHISYDAQRDIFKMQLDPLRAEYISKIMFLFDLIVNPVIPVEQSCSVLVR